VSPVNGFVFLTALLVAALAGNSFFATDPTPSNVAMQLLGRNQGDALSTLRKLDPGAIAGPVCRGQDGVSASVTFTNEPWQVLGHLEDGSISDVLIRSVRRTAGRPGCARITEAAIANLKASHPDWLAKVSRADLGQQGLMMIALGSLENGTTLNVMGDRSSAQSASCALAISYRLRPEK
jgi:hypothetical protein